MGNLPGPKRKDMTGQRFGKLVVIRQDDSKHGHGAFWFCHCDCGGSISTRGDLLRVGKSVSCGCVARQRLEEHRVTLHGHTRRGTIERTLFCVWWNMIDRCSNPENAAWARYGGRGIKVAEEWLDFANFVKDLLPTYSPGLTLDRRDNDQGYTPENVKWATPGEQSRNKSNNVWLQTPVGIFCKRDVVFMYGKAKAKTFERVSRGA